jgi:hypothetical protein
MDSERVTVELTNWVVVALYFVISALTVAAALYLVFTVTAVVMRGGLRDYCYHGGGGELIFWAFVFGWPVIALHVVISYFAARRIRRSMVVAVTSVLPIVLFIGGVPCI